MIDNASGLLQGAVRGARNFMRNKDWKALPDGHKEVEKVLAKCKMLTDNGDKLPAMYLALLVEMASVLSSVTKADIRKLHKPEAKGFNAICKVVKDKLADESVIAALAPFRHGEADDAAADAAAATAADASAALDKFGVIDVDVEELDRATEREVGEHVSRDASGSSSSGSDSSGSDSSGSDSSGSDSSDSGSSDSGSGSDSGSDSDSDSDSSDSDSSDSSRSGSDTNADAGKQGETIALEAEDYLNMIGRHFWVRKESTKRKAGTQVKSRAHAHQGKKETEDDGPTIQALMAAVDYRAPPIEPARMREAVAAARLESQRGGSHRRPNAQAELARGLISGLSFLATNLSSGSIRDAAAVAAAKASKIAADAFLADALAKFDADAKGTGTLEASRGRLPSSRSVIIDADKAARAAAPLCHRAALAAARASVAASLASAGPGAASEPARPSLLEVPLLFSRAEIAFDSAHRQEEPADPAAADAASGAGTDVAPIAGTTDRGETRLIDPCMTASEWRTGFSAAWRILDALDHALERGTLVSLLPPRSDDIDFQVLDAKHAQITNFRAWVQASQAQSAAASGAGAHEGKVGEADSKAADKAGAAGAADASAGVGGMPGGAGAGAAAAFSAAPVAAKTSTKGLSTTAAAALSKAKRGLGGLFALERELLELYPASEDETHAADADGLVEPEVKRDARGRVLAGLRAFDGLDRLISKLHEHLYKALQQADPHGPAYAERLPQEGALLVLALRAMAWLRDEQRDATAAAACAAIALETIGYRNARIHTALHSRCVADVVECLSLDAAAACARADDLRVIDAALRNQVLTASLGAAAPVALAGPQRERSQREAVERVNAERVEAGLEPIGAGGGAKDKKGKKAEKKRVKREAADQLKAKVVFAPGESGKAAVRAWLEARSGVKPIVLASMEASKAALRIAMNAADTALAEASVRTATRWFDLASRAALEQVTDLSVFVFRHGVPRNKVRAAIARAHSLAMHHELQQARDLVLMTRLQEQIDTVGADSKVMYHRCIATIGLEAFRQGNMRQAFAALTDICRNGMCGDYIGQPLSRRRPEKVPETDAELVARLSRQVPFHMQLSTEVLEAAFQVSSMAIEVPSMAHEERDPSVHVQSPHFRRELERAAETHRFAGPPETVSDFAIAAGKLLAAADWRSAIRIIRSMPAWRMLPPADREGLLDNVEIALRKAALVTFLHRFSPHYDSLSHDYLADMFQLDHAAIFKTASRMMLERKLIATWDRPTRTIVMHAGHRTPLQAHALEFAGKVAVLVTATEEALRVRAGKGEYSKDDAVKGYNFEATGRRLLSMENYDHGRRGNVRGGRGRTRMRPGGRGGKSEGGGYRGGRGGHRGRR